MSEPSQKSTGILGLLRQAAHSGLGLVKNRIELLGIELQEEKCRLVEVLALAIAGVFLAVIGLAVLTVGIAFFVGEEARPYFLLGAGLLYATLAVVMFILVRNKLKSGPRPFSETVSQFKKDREWLDSLNEK